MKHSLPTPLGPMLVEEAAGRLVRVTWSGAPGPGGSALLERAAAELAEYFSGERQAFDLPLALSAGLTGEVQRAMLAIPFGETTTYGAIAKRLGVPAQAVGQACGANSLPVIVPCHRVLGATGLGGFSAAGGVETKVWLLRHEGAAGLLI
jgi:methylated-DNA-[protein]-cysteine S-methyltransferase